MHISSLFSATALVAAATGAVLPRQDASYYGYLLSTFTDADPRVFWYLSTAENPLAFTALNGGSPVLESTVGTKAVRDVFLTANQEKSEYFVIATDLDINADGFSWDEATRRGSRGLTVWRSENLVDWSAPTLAIIEDETAGMAWAPSVVWNTTESQYYLFWSSRLYNTTDTNHTGTATLDRIRYTTTTDFVTFAPPADYLALDSENIPLIDQEFLALGDTPGHYVRFLKDENVLHVYQETTTGGLFGEWTRAEGYIQDGVVYEGPAAFPDIQDATKFHLLLDNYVEYVPFESTDVATAEWVASDRTGFSTGLKHGNVVLVTKGQYDAIVARYGA
ncbi:arabinosidase [Aspergillus japonicus CBS 114.51]|uniref:Arabinosidase n=1 Tax=Aspergillus japonicus CBS 114.51 TaxID=1448312 RepID=A0A8T8WLK2_ASPJA|nr:arabinosidase [Aspergillus japonicus CBS 114.51]RAH76574.1 arabinosidase [Aspergillus japonicus CBS 114.51]